MEKTPNGNNKKKKESFGEKAEKTLKKAKAEISDRYEKLRKSEKVAEFRSMAVKHQRETAVYVVLLIGLITSLFHPFLGQAIIGIVVGIYFADEIISKSKKLNDFVDRQGVFRIVIFLFTAVALFLAAPGIFLGAALAIGIKILISDK